MTTGQYDVLSTLKDGPKDWPFPHTPRQYGSLEERMQDGPTPYRDRRGAWKPRQKPHLQPPRREGAKWLCQALLPDGVAYNTIGDTAVQAYGLMLQNQRQR